MKPDLLGYVLKTLSPEEWTEVEAHLERSPAAAREVAALRAALEPLATDAEEIAPPPQLFARTLQGVAVQICRRVPAPMPISMPKATQRVAHRSTWRRADLLVAATIAFVFFMLVPPALIRARDRQAVVECGDNLHRYYVALSQYSQQPGHDGYLPHPQRGGIFSAAGVTNVALREAGLWDGSMQATCPAKRCKSLPPLPPTMAEVRSQLTDANCKDRLRTIYASLGGCYGYHLGYEDETGQFVGVRRSLGDHVPIMADRPPRESESVGWQVNNSPNHGGRGQNVLYLGGHVRFVNARLIGDDDIYLNRSRRLAAGQGSRDTVLGPGEARPFPDVE